jgi:hypothetical protein
VSSTSRSFTIPGGASGGRGCSRSGRYTCTRLRRACYTPRLAKGEAVREVAKADLRAEFRRQPSETIGSAPRADAAGNPDDDERVVGEALLPVKTSVRLRFP